MDDATRRRGLGVLAWRDTDALAANLAGYVAVGLPDLFAERVVFFREVTDEKRAVAARHGFRAEGASGNLGVLGGRRAMAETLSTDLVLLLEDDLPLVEGADEVRRQVALATDHLLSGRAQVVRLRSRREPGAAFGLPDAYRRYHGEGALPALRRTLRPGKAKRLVGGAPYVRDKADRAHRGLIDRADDGTYLVSAACLPWTNQAVMLRRDVFLERVAAHAGAGSGRRRADGRLGTGKAWNAHRWQRSGWTVAVPEGLFTHGHLPGHGGG